jgi:hypothetical protein
MTDDNDENASDVESYSDGGNMSGSEEGDDTGEPLTNLNDPDVKDEEEVLSPEEKSARDALLREEEDAFRKQKEAQLKSLEAVREAEAENESGVKQEVTQANRRLQFLMAQVGIDYEKYELVGQSIFDAIEYCSINVHRINDRS